MSKALQKLCHKTCSPNTITHDQVPLSDIPARLMAKMPAVPPGTHNIAETKLHGVKSEDNVHL